MPTFQIEDALVLMRRTLAFPPAIVGWNRLEGRPRTVQFDRALRAEVRDALWFLTRQWQFGEFKGEDAGSPVEVRTAVRVDALQHYAVKGQAGVAYDAAVPLETHAEREPVAFDLVIHAQVTRYFWQLITGIPNEAGIKALYRAAFPLRAVSGVEDYDSRHALEVGRARLLDAADLLAATAGTLHDTRVDGFSGVPVAHKSRLKKAGRDLRAWFAAQFSQPADPVDDAWKPRFLE